MSKWFLASKTIWGGIIVIVPGILPLIGINIPAVDIQALGDTVNALFSTLFPALNEVIGAALIVYGRFRANGGITLKIPS